MKNSRQRILDHIRKRRRVTIAELSETLHTTESNIRHHLGILQEDGLVVVVGERPQPGRGRPTQVFGPDPRSLGDQVDLLADALLLEIESSLPPEEAGYLLLRVADRLIAILQGELPSTPTGEPVAAAPGDRPGDPARSHPTQRLYAAIQQLNRQGYHARWEPRPDAPRVILEHCPFAPLIDRHPWLCRMDQRLLEALLGRPVDQLAHRVEDGRGVRQCVFRVD